MRHNIFGDGMREFRSFVLEAAGERFRVTFFSVNVGHLEKQLLAMDLSTRALFGPRDSCRVANHTPTATRSSIPGNVVQENLRWASEASVPSPSTTTDCEDAIRRFRRLADRCNDHSARGTDVILSLDLPSGQP